ncbi:MAG TPA: DUF2510 domain-containing protein [Iamia sp.]|jgi:hypothetical protein|nr:DUF2510 domain-containing protein [Iamia sp.]
MARRHPLTPGPGARRAARVILATSVMGLALATAPLVAGAQEAGSVPTLAQVLDGEVDGVSATARATPADEDMGVVVAFANDGDHPVEVAIPFGTLVVTAQEGDQTLAVTPPPSPEVVEVAAEGGTPTIEIDAGSSTEELPAYCTELGDGYPYDGASVTPIDDAHPVLADTLRAATAAGSDHATTQDAVWWLTDEPSAPVDDDLADLLAVDPATFAASPYRVVPDTGYVPLWMRDQVPPGDGGSMSNPSPYDEEEAAGILDESFEGPASPTSGSSDGGVGPGIMLWVVFAGLVVVTAVVVATRAGRARPVVNPVLARTTPGWYPDPWGGGGHRYWDGQRWTTRVMGPR